MAVWIEVATQAWGQLVRPGTNAPLTNGVPSINTTVRATASDTGTVIAPADWKSDKDGLLPGFVAEGTWLFIEPDGQSRTVEAISGSSQAAQDAKIAVLREAPLNVKDSRFGAIGDGVANDTAAITAARALSAPYGRELLFPPGRYKDTAQRTLQTGETWRGAGGILDANERGVTTIESTFNGEYLIVPNSCNNWAIENLSLKGDTTLAAQDLLACKQTGQGAVRRVGILKAGRDNVTLTGALNIHFDTVYHALAKRRNLFVVGQSNAILWSKCLFRVATEWGIWIQGGMNLVFVAPTIESNNNNAAPTINTGGGMMMDPNDPDPAAYINVVLVGAHFENHGPGRPVDTGLPGRGFAFSEFASTYNETTPCRFRASGIVESNNVTANAAPHAIIGSTLIHSTWINPRKDGGGEFTLDDTSGGNALILASRLPTSLKAGIRMGDVELFRDGNGHLQMNTAGRKIVAVNGFGTNAFAAASTLGTLTRKMEIFAGDGTSLGFIPIYGSIT